MLNIHPCVTEGFIAMTDCCRLFDGRMDVAGGGLTDGRQLEARISSDESPGLVGAAECSTFQKVPLDLLYSENMMLQIGKDVGRYLKFITS